MVKLQFLYHASSTCKLKIIEPRNETAPEGFREGKVIFATDGLSFATQFIVPTDDSWTNGGVPYFVIGDKIRFLKKDKGGSIYLVPSKDFRKYNKREFVSKRKTRTVSEICFSSGLDAMIIHDVQVYFVDKHTFAQIQKSSDHGVSIMNGLISENEKRGYKVEKLDIYRGSKKKIVV
jgi:hypothetical protein